MVFSESMQFNQSTSDNLNPADNTVPDLEKTDEKYKQEEHSTIIHDETIGHAFILGHATNGVLGVANGVDGNQILLGDYKEGQVLKFVVNPNKTFRERFRTTTFDDGGDMNWDTTNQRLSLE